MIPCNSGQSRLLFPQIPAVSRSDKKNKFHEKNHTGRAWGGDLIVFVGPGVGHLTDLALPGEGIFESFFARRGDIRELKQQRF